MKIPATSILLALFGFAVRAGAQFDMLADDPLNKYLAKVTFTDVYAEKAIVVAPADPASGTPAQHDTLPGEKLGAKVIANLGDFNLNPETDLANPGEMGDDLPVSVQIGAFTFSATLGDSVPMDKNGNPAFSYGDGKHDSSDFKLAVPALDAFGNPKTDAAGDPVMKSGGTVKFAWAKRPVTVDKVKKIFSTLTITVNIIDAIGAALGDIDTATHVNEYDDGVKGGTGPVAETIPVTVAFGSALGTRDINVKGISSTTHKHYGSDGMGGFLEDLAVNTVNTKNGTLLPSPATN